jgi:chemotaxis protein methyltransferase CheR
MALVHDERYDDASPLVQQLLDAQPHNNGARLLQAYIHLNRRNFELAMDGCSDVLAADAWSVDALFVMGLAEKWREQLAASIAWFKKAAYLHQQCWPAHFYLAGLYSAQGDHAAAGRAHRVVLRLLAGAPDPGIRVVPVGLRPAEVRFLCERRLNVVPASVPLGGR